MSHIDFTLYNVLLGQLSETPDLSVAQKRMPIPEGWPVVLQQLNMFRKKIYSFTVSDGTHTLVCRFPLPERYDKVGVMEPGTIIHLIGSEVVFDPDQRTYVLDLQDVYTLKEYDDFLKKREQEEQRRMAKLREDGFFDTFDTAIERAMSYSRSDEE